MLLFIQFAQIFTFIFDSIFQFSRLASKQIFQDSSGCQSTGIGHVQSCANFNCACFSENKNACGMVYGIFLVSLIVVSLELKDRPYQAYTACAIPKLIYFHVISETCHKKITCTCQIVFRFEKIPVSITE